jgi:hypothetical protein
MGATYPSGAQVGVELEAELGELREGNRALQAETERLEDAFAEQKVHVVDGYVVLAHETMGKAPPLKDVVA